MNDKKTLRDKLYDTIKEMSWFEILKLKLFGEKDES